MIKVCFVCSGNTCRSVMAERLAKRYVKKNGIKNVKFLSRGISANGENITENAKKVLKAMGASGANRRSVKLGKLDKNTLYVTMTEAQQKMLAGGKVISFHMLLGHDILDPYGYDIDVYTDTANQIQHGIQILIAKILGLGDVR